MSEATSTGVRADLGLWSRLRHTPLRDIVRGRATGRLNVRHMIEQAGLPRPIGDLVMRIVRASRLTRLERVDVAEELIAHFRDGLDAGANPDTLIEAFGDIYLSGRLIRRAKKCLRPMWWQVMARGTKACAWLLAVIVALYLGSAAMFFLSGPGPIVDYRPQINAAALDIPDGERAWPVYRVALLALPDVPEFSVGFNREPRPGEDGWERIESFLTDHAAALAEARQAATLPGLGFVPGHAFSETDQRLWPEAKFSERDIREHGLFAILLPHLAPLRSLGRLLRHDALRAAAAGDGATAIADIRAITGIAAHVRETPLLVNDLISLALDHLAFDAAGDVLANWPDALSDAQLQDLAHMIAARDQPALRLRFDGERLGFRDIVQRLYSDDGDGDGRLTAAGMRMMLHWTGVTNQGPSSDGDAIAAMALGPVLRTVGLTRRQAIEEYDVFMDALEALGATPAWQRDDSAIQVKFWKWNESALARARYLPLAALAPALTNATYQVDRVMQHRDGVLIAIALEMYRRRHGAWPAALDEMVPAFLPAAPVDRCDGRPMRYALVEGRPVVYSIGPDGDDDGGAAPATDDPVRGAASLLVIKGSSAPDGDWVLWPVEHEPLVASTPEQLSDE